jgi:outer membrane cobalamin receptor
MLTSDVKSKLWLFRAIVLGGFSERGTPGPVLMGYVESENARLYENNTSIILKAEREIGRDVFSAGMMYRCNYQDFFDTNSPNALRGDTVSVFKTNDIQMSMQYTGRFKTIKLLYGFEAEFTGLHGDFLQPEVNNYVNRFQSGIYVRSVFNIIENENIVLPLQLAARYDFYTDVEGSPTGLAGFSILFKELNTILKSQFAYNYRAPGFNEMYYLNYGTMDLKPERSTSFDFTLSYKPDFLIFEMNGFLINTKDQIIAVPKSPLTWSAQNMAEVVSRGLEFVFDVDLFNDIFHTGGSYTIQSVIDNNESSPTYKHQVVYVPQETATVKISATYAGFYSSLNAHYTGFTYFLPENVYTAVIPAFWLFNFNFSKEFSFARSFVTVKFDVINLSNKEYVVIKNYPMPGRLFRLGITYKLL